MRGLFFRAALAIAVVGASSAGAATYVRALLPPDGAVARGVTLDGEDVSGEEASTAAARAAARVLARRVKVTFDASSALDPDRRARDREVLVTATLGELGAVVDVAAIERELLDVARRGDVFSQVDDAMEARAGRRDVVTRVLVPADVIAARLELSKDALDAPPIAAKLIVAEKRATAHQPGRYLDAFAAAEAVQRAVDAAPRSNADIDLAVPLFELAPRASSEAVARIDTSAVVSRYETRFGYLGGQANRGKNIARAASGMDGVVLMPGDVVSFNANVGPRSLENGFNVAPEIYKGELREGVGGGTCQVAGTLHAAAYLAGLNVLERANHSRPSGYIRMGLDATVVYPTVDLKLQNPFDFPIVLHASIDKGTLEFQLLGKERPATVDFATETLGTTDFKRKVEEKEGMPDGKFVLKQHGIRGYSIKKTRTIHLRGGAEHVEVTHDTYPPTFEIYWVAKGTDPAILPDFATPGT